MSWHNLARSGQRLPDIVTLDLGWILPIGRRARCTPCFLLCQHVLIELGPSFTLPCPA